MHVIVMIAPDGTISVAGPFATPGMAGKRADEIVSLNPGLDATVHPLTSARDIFHEIIRPHRS